MPIPKKILFVLNEASYFLSHRLPIGEALLKKGHVVHVAAPMHEDAARRIESQGMTFHALNLSRRGMNPWEETQSITELYRLYRTLSPDLVHHVTIKPVLYGGIAAQLARVPAVVSAVSGLGHVFVSQGLKVSLLKAGVKQAYRVALSHPNARVIFQNPDDQAVFTGNKLIDPDHAVLIRGSGADTQVFKPLAQPATSAPVAVLAARMLWKKGVGEFVEAARTLQTRGVELRCVLVGDTDDGNPGAISREQLTKWHDEGVIEWWGWRNDMIEVFSQSHIFCLPSTYGEGVPKVLIEAAACARPIVTTDWPGCREIVQDGHNGRLVPIRDPLALADALEQLAREPNLRQEMGARGRTLVEREFSTQTVVEQTLAVYDELGLFSDDASVRAVS